MSRKNHDAVSKAAKTAVTRPGKELAALLPAYLLSRWKALSVFAGTIFIFWAVYSLFHLPPEPALYSALICCLLGAAAAAWDGYHFTQKALALRRLPANFDGVAESLPAPSGFIEEEYQALIQNLRDEMSRLISQRDSRQTERDNYYTLWAHQIKTPISAMRLVLQGDGQPDRGELEQELFQIERYVEMALQYLRLDNMSSDLLLREVSLEDLVKQAVRKYAMLFIRRRLTLTLDAGSLAVPVVTDEKWTVFVLEQILSNALKYTAAGGVSIRLDPDQEKTLLIEDTGIGIQPEDVPRIFERGFTGYNGRMDQKSTGLGLYLCCQVLSRLSHEIKVDSQPGKGTRVSICFAATAPPPD